MKFTRYNNPKRKRRRSKNEYIPPMIIDSGASRVIYDPMTKEMIVERKEENEEKNV